MYNDAEIVRMVKPCVLARLVNFRNETAPTIISIVDYLATRHLQDGNPLRALGGLSHVSPRIIRKIFDTYEIPIRSQAEIIKKKWKDSKFRERQAEATKKKWKDSKFRERQAEAVKKMLHERWKDSKFRERQAEAVRISKKNYIDSEKGYREDLGFKTNSRIGANLGRIIGNIERKYEHNKNFDVERISGKKTNLKLDYLTKDARGNDVAYLVIAHPNNITREKIRSLRDKYGIRVRIVDEKFYGRLAERFTGRIDNWEMNEN